MQLSEPITIQFRGQAALLRLLRSDGFCWGRIRVAGKSQLFDVIPPRDLYEQPDHAVLAALAVYAQDDSCVEPSLALAE